MSLWLARDVFQWTIAHYEIAASSTYPITTRRNGNLVDNRREGETTGAAKIDRKNTTRTRGTFLPDDERNLLGMVGIQLLIGRSRNAASGSINVGAAANSAP